MGYLIQTYGDRATGKKNDFLNISYKQNHITNFTKYILQSF